MENENNWLKQELEQLNENKTEYEKLPSLQFEEGKITTFQVNADKPFEKWIDQANNTVKKIIPVTHMDEEKNLWINVKNPLYSELVRELYDGKRTFSVFQTGTGKDTKYSMVKD